MPWFILVMSRKMLVCYQVLMPLVGRVRPKIAEVSSTPLLEPVECDGGVRIRWSHRRIGGCLGGFAVKIVGNGVLADIHLSMR